MATLDCVIRNPLSAMGWGKTLKKYIREGRDNVAILNVVINCDAQMRAPFDGIREYITESQNLMGLVISVIDDNVPVADMADSTRPHVTKALVRFLLDAANINRGNLRNVSLVGCRYDVAALAPIASRMQQLSMSWSVCDDQLADNKSKRKILLDALEHNRALQMIRIPADFSGIVLESILRLRTVQTLPLLYVELHSMKDANSLKDYMLAAPEYKKEICVVDTAFEYGYCETILRGFSQIANLDMYEMTFDLSDDSNTWTLAAWDHLNAVAGPYLVGPPNQNDICVIRVPPTRRAPAP